MWKVRRSLADATRAIDTLKQKWKWILLHVLVDGVSVLSQWT